MTWLHMVKPITPKKEELKIISPIHEALNLSGNISYGESQHAWNGIRFKKELLDEFSQLRKRRDRFSYKMTLHRSYKELKSAIGQMEKKSIPVPLLMLFGMRE